MGAVAALAFMELCRVRRINGDYTGALHYLAKSAIYFDDTVRNDESTLSARFDKQEHSLDSYKREARLQSLLRDHLHDPRTLQEALMPRFTLSPCLEVSPEEATIIFECIKENSQSDEDWAQVAADCNVLATAEFVTWDEDEAWEDYGIALHWNEYWQRARGWAEAQLGENEYRKRSQGV